jgi:hypothetical protein
MYSTNWCSNSIANHPVADTVNNSTSRMLLWIDSIDQHILFLDG